MTASQSPLAGIRVLEFSHFLAGPYAGLVLADLGADVIRVEDPDYPDEARTMGPCFRDGESFYFLALNWAKRSLAVRLRTPLGNAVTRDLVAGADVVMHNYRPRVMAKLGLDHRSLERVNPRIITCSLTGFGESGPYADRPGYDYTIQALTGVMSLTGEPDGPPAKAGISYVDHSGALSAALAICAGLVGRMTTGRGRHIDLGLLDTQVSMLTYLAAWQMNSSYQPERLSNSSHPSLVPAQNFRTADGYLSLFVGNDAMWRRLVEALDDKVLASPRFSTREGREAGRKDLLARLQELLAGDSSLGWAKRLAEAGVACAPVNTLSAGLADPHVSARGLLAEARHGAYGDYAHTRGPVPAMSSASTRGAPLLGEHTVEILLDLGYSKERVDSLIESGVVCCPPKS